MFVVKRVACWSIVQDKCSSSSDTYTRRLCSSTWRRKWTINCRKSMSTRRLWTILGTFDTHGIKYSYHARGMNVCQTSIWSSLSCWMCARLLRHMNHIERLFYWLKSMIEKGNDTINCNDKVRLSDRIAQWFFPIDTNHRIQIWQQTSPSSSFHFLSYLFLMFNTV
jgi:hypothetical protein